MLGKRPKTVSGNPGQATSTAWTRGSDIANSITKKTPRKIICQDPRIKELILRRIALTRTHDGRQRFQLTTEIRELIKTDTRSKRRAAVKEAFARHTDWGKIASELRIDRPQSAPVFSINGKRTTSDEEAITAIAKHIETIYSKPSQPIRIPPWNQGHGIRALDIHEAVGLAATAAKKGKAKDGSGLSNACIKSQKKGAIGCIASLIQESGKVKKGFPEQWKFVQGLLLHKKGDRDLLTNYRLLSIAPTMSRLLGAIFS